MRRVGGKVFIILGVILALAAFAGVVIAMRGTQEKTKAAEVSTRKVVVATTDIPVRSKITSDDVTLKDMPLEAIPPMAVTEVYSVTDRIALTDIFAGQVILESMVSSAETSSSLLPALSVPPGMVAMTLPVNEVSGVAEALREGDRVDVIVALRVIEYDPQGNESMPEYSAQFTIQNVQVLHIGRWAAPMPEEATEEGAKSGLLGAGGGRVGGSAVEPLSVVTLLVEPQDALVLKYALDKKIEENREAFTLVLRAMNSSEVYSTEAVNQDYMVQRFNFSRPPFIIRK